MDQADDKGGYEPLWTADLQNKTDAISSALWVSFVRRFLLLDGGGGSGSRAPASPPLPVPGALVATIGHDVPDAQYRILKGGSVAAQVDGHTKLYIHTAASDKGLHADPAPPSPSVAFRTVSSQSAASVTASCPQENSTSPCGLGWGPSAWGGSLKQLMKMWSYSAFSAALGDTVTLAGAPVFTAVVRLGGGGASASQAAAGAAADADPHQQEGGGVAAALVYSPPDAPAGYKGWLVTQGMATYDHVDPRDSGPYDGVAAVAAGFGGSRQVRIELDHRLITLEKGQDYWRPS